MAKKENRLVVTLACGDCKNRNYTTEKNKKNDTTRLEMKKFCPNCHKTSFQHGRSGNP